MSRKIEKLSTYFNPIAPMAMKQMRARETIAYNHFLSRLDYLTIMVYPVTGKLPPAIKTYRNLCTALTTYCGLTFSEYDYLLSIEKAKEPLWQI